MINFVQLVCISLCVPPGNYVDAIGEEVVSEIIAATGRGPSNHDYGVGGHEAFTSIVFAPKVWKPPSEAPCRLAA